MKYRNIKNGSVIDIPCILTDVNWKAQEPSNTQSDKESQEETEPKKNTKKTVKKG